MFEFFVFQAGGLVLWPTEPDSTQKSYIEKYISNEILGNHESNDESMMILHRHDTETNLYFTVSIQRKIGEQIPYLEEMLERVEERFLHQYERVLDQRDSVLLLPEMFSKFDVSPIVDEYRGRALKGQSPKPVQSPVSKPNQNSGQQKEKKESKEKKQKKDDFKRPGFVKKKEEVKDESSQQIGSAKEDVIEVEQYDLDDFEGIFRPTEKPATGIANLFKAIVGEKTLTQKELDPILREFQDHLISKNVAAHIAADITANVGEKLVGTKCTNFSNIKQIVRASLKEAIERILTPDRQLDVIRRIQSTKDKGELYVMAFVGVNGVGKSTSLSKVAYLFKSHGFKVLIAACDTYRNGAVDQLHVHSERLDIELYEKGGGQRDPVPVAKQAKDYAKQNGFDVLLIDTAGRMQNDVNLMRQIARLVNETKPDLTVFVAEALVGNNGSDQIRSFDKSLREYNGGQGTKGLDGIILTKFDTIDDKVGASLTLVFETGHPIVFLGVGQHYRDLRKMNPEFVVSTLLEGF